MKRCYSFFSLFFIFFIFLLLTNCQNKEKQLEKKLYKTIENYIIKDLKEKEHLDSIVILKIDSISDFHFVKYIVKPVIDNHIEELSFINSYLSDTNDIKDLQLKQKNETKINTLIDKINYYETQLANGELDSTNFSYYFVSVIIHTTLSLKPKQEYYGFPITTDFHIHEVKEILE